MPRPRPRAGPAPTPSTRVSCCRSTGRDVEIADLQTELGDHQQKAKDLKKLLDSTPQLEAQYAQLSRDYDINKKQYAALLASYDKARLGQQAGNAGAVRFELVRDAHREL